MAFHVLECIIERWVIGGIEQADMLNRGITDGSTIVHQLYHVHLEFTVC
jgi:hypothetical protein